MLQGYPFLSHAANERMPSPVSGAKFDAGGDSAVAASPSIPAGTGGPDAITFVLPGTGAGGSEHVVTMLCNHFAGKGSRVRLICFDPPGTEPFYPLDRQVALVQLGWETRLSGRMAGLWTMLKRYRLLKAEFERMRPDIVVAFLTRTNILAARAAHGLGIPVVVSERNNPQRQKLGASWEWLRKRAYGRADALVTMTGGAGRYFAPVAGRADWVIPNHAKLPDCPVSTDRAGRRLVAVGRLVEQKGFDLLLEAFARIAPDFPDWQLTIWGEGPQRGALEKRRRELGLDGRIAMPGVTERPGSWIAEADLFVLSSRFEGWGLVLGEAMAAGIPVVSFDCPWGPSEMIEHGKSGLLAPDQDVTALAGTLARAMTDPDLRERLGAAGREAMRRHAPDRILAQWDALVASVLGGGSPIPETTGR